MDDKKAFIAALNTALREHSSVNAILSYEKSGEREWLVIDTWLGNCFHIPVNGDCVKIMQDVIDALREEESEPLEEDYYD